MFHHQLYHQYDKQNWRICQQLHHQSDKQNWCVDQKLYQESEKQNWWLCQQPDHQSDKENWCICQQLYQQSHKQKCVYVNSFIISLMSLSTALPSVSKKKKIPYQQLYDLKKNLNQNC